LFIRKYDLFFIDFELVKALCHTSFNFRNTPEIKEYYPLMPLVSEKKGFSFYRRFSSKGSETSPRGRAAMALLHGTMLLLTRSPALSYGRAGLDRRHAHVPVAAKLSHPHPRPNFTEAGPRATCRWSPWTSKHRLREKQLVP
jgi:hypothetical protein